MAKPKRKPNSIQAADKPVEMGFTQSFSSILYSSLSLSLFLSLSHVSTSKPVNPKSATHHHQHTHRHIDPILDLNRFRQTHTVCVSVSVLLPLIKFPLHCQSSLSPSLFLLTHSFNNCVSRRRRKAAATQEDTVQLMLVVATWSAAAAVKWKVWAAAAQTHCLLLLLLR